MRVHWTAKGNNANAERRGLTAGIFNDGIDSKQVRPDASQPADAGAHQAGEIDGYVFIRLSDACITTRYTERHTTPAAAAAAASSSSLVICVVAVVDCCARSHFSLDSPLDDHSRDPSLEIFIADWGQLEGEWLVRPFLKRQHFQDLSVEDLARLCSCCIPYRRLVCMIQKLCV